MTEEAKNPTEEKPAATMQELRPEAMRVLQTYLKAGDPPTALAAARIVIKSCDARAAWLPLAAAIAELVLTVGTGLAMGSKAEKAVVANLLAASGDTLGSLAALAANLSEKARNRLLQRVKEQDVATYHGLMALLIVKSGKVTDADIPADIWAGHRSPEELAASIEKLSEAERAVRLAHIKETCELVYHSIMAVILKKREQAEAREGEVEPCGERDCKPKV